MHANCAYGSMAPMPFDESLPDGPYTPELEPFQAQDGDSLRLSDSFPKVIFNCNTRRLAVTETLTAVSLSSMRICERCTCSAMQTTRSRVPAAVCPCTRAGNLKML